MKTPVPGKNHFPMLYLGGITKGGNDLSQSHHVTFLNK